ncbi:MAG: trypsin-like serine protease [Acidobacteriota bacterium]|nr:trypsin-like serine protease [Acidobacteriota bacterium]
MRRKLSIAIAAVFAVGLSVTLLAVKYGVPDDGEHPYVGLVVFYDAGMVPQWRCTATLISPTVLLTAGHCSELNGPARVWFDETVTAAAGYPTAGGYTGTAYTYPGWQGGLYLPDTGDAGIVVLDTPVSGVAAFPSLADVGFLDELATARGTKNVSFEVVGYGLQSVKPVLSQFRTRLKAWVQLVNLRSALTDGYNIQTTNSPGKGTGPGGTCFGDSGGAIFSEAGEIVAVNSFVLNGNCAGASFGYRVDTADVQQWILSFVN